MHYQGLRRLAVLHFSEFAVGEGSSHINLIDWLRASHVGQIDSDSMNYHIASLRRGLCGCEADVPPFTVPIFV